MNVNKLHAKNEKDLRDRAYEENRVVKSTTRIEIGALALVAAFSGIVAHEWNGQPRQETPPAIEKVVTLEQEHASTVDSLIQSECHNTAADAKLKEEKIAAVNPNLAANNFNTDPTSPINVPVGLCK